MQRYPAAIPCHWDAYVQIVGDLLARTSASERMGAELNMDKALRLWHDAALEVRTADREIFFIGNGASASMASHCAADIMKNSGIRTRVLTDLSALSALANDEGYDNVFALPLQWYMREGDMLVAISSSGRSPNILQAVETAHRKGGSVATLSAFDADNPLRQAGDWNFYVPAPHYGWAESCHAAILHHWMDMASVGMNAL